MLRGLVTLVSCWGACLPAFAQGDPVAVTLSLDAHRTVYKIGEPILLHLTFTANKPGLSLNVTVTEPASPIDNLLVSPKTGIFPWRDDQARGHRYTPDYAVLAPLKSNEPQVLTLPLNSVYRFDMPGHYTVQVVTNRVLRGGIEHSDRVGPLMTNSVTFDIEPMTEAEDANRATALERKIREAPDLRIAQQYAEELYWLTGDASTRVKLSLFLHPKTFYPFGVDVSRGLWIARNRPLVVAELERALRDPNQQLSAGSSLLGLTVSLKARLESPFNSGSPATPLETQRIEGEYLKLIAASLPAREGRALVDAARTVFVQLAQRKETAEPHYAAAHEVLITRFGEVDQFDVHSLLNTYGEYLRDARIVPALKQILQNQHDPCLNLERTAVLKQLMEITAADSRSELVSEVCGENPTLLQGIDTAPFETLPETDECLNSKIHAAAANPAKQLGAGRRPGVLIEDAWHKAVSFGGSIPAGNAGAFLAARTYAYPGSELARSGKGGGGGSGFGDDLLGGAEGHAGDFTQPREGGLVRLEPLTEFAVQLLDALLYLLDLLQRLREQESTSGPQLALLQAVSQFFRAGLHASYAQGR